MRLALPSLLLTLVIACTGDDADTDTEDTEDTGENAYASDWAGVQALVADHCAVCHGGDTAVTMLPTAIEADLRAEGGRYVVPNDPAASKLWRVLSGEVIEGDYAPMPLGTGPLPAHLTRHVEAWILAGAPLPAEPPPEDADADGHPAETDCDDDDASVNPAATELCNGKDDDCDSEIDEPSAEDAPTWYADADGDGFGDPAVATVSCVQPAEHVAEGTDCDDDRAGVNPGATELCNGRDDDCDGDTDVDATDAPTWYPDGDDDGYGVDTGVITACADPSSETNTYADRAGDCDDTNHAFRPDAIEADCTDTTDYNCDGVAGAIDNDDDGFFACEECDDNNAAVNPDAIELCNTIEDNCDGLLDGADAADAGTWYADVDGDGFGAGPAIKACAQPANTAENNRDCDDNNAAVKPGAVERCNTIEDNCDGIMDGPDAVDASTWTVDADNDGHGAIGGATQRACNKPSLHAASSDDCDDNNPDVNPSAADTVANGVDNDCDGRIDQDSPSAPPFWELDVQPMFSSVGCIGCHGFTRSGLLAQNGPGGTKFITPGNLAQSYVWLKVNNTQSSVGGGGNRMPQGGQLTATQLDLLRRWIEAGAPN